ncbi:MAG TPA: hydrogenase expression/formation protein HypE [Gemmatimonadaceae bacterium]|nr:hydrogenase expression/formation protein HypE [Gemmatimonadaceae bacterium]
MTTTRAPIGVPAEYASAATRPRAENEVIALKHGFGGKAMRRLIGETLAAGFVDIPVDGYGLSAMDDGAALRIGDKWLVVTTDAHVVHPVFFPGGDIGRLAVAGTVNDLAMMGATEPLGLTCAVVIEEGFPRADLERIHGSMLRTCREAGTTVLTGDTKVMGRGDVDGIVITTTGVALTSCVIRDAALQPGDRLIVTGTIGDHGVALMARRHELMLDGDLQSDCAPLNRMIRDALHLAPGAIVAMKDPTRGGLSSALHEMAQKSAVGIVIRERDVPLRDDVRAAAEVLGLDCFHIANEGKALLGVRGGDAAVSAVLDALHRHAAGVNAAEIGECVANRGGDVVLDTGLGKRLMIESEGEPLPRIC